MLHSILGRKKIYSYTVTLQYTQEVNSCYSSEQLLKGILIKEGTITENFEDWCHVWCHSMCIAMI